MTQGELEQDPVRKQLRQEIERLKSELAESQKSGQQAAEAYQSAGEELFKVQAELEQAKAEVDLANALMRPTELMVKVVEDQLKQAHEQIADDVAACIDFHDQLNAALGEAREAKERIRELEAENVLLRKAFDGAMHPHTFTVGSTEIKDHS